MICSRINDSRHWVVVVVVNYLAFILVQCTYCPRCVFRR